MNMYADYMNITSTIGTKLIRTNNNMKKLRGGQKTTWIKNIEKYLNKLKLHPQESITEVTQDRAA